MPLRVRAFAGRRARAARRLQRGVRRPSTSASAPRIVRIRRPLDPRKRQTRPHLGNICSWGQHLPTCSLNLLESVRNIVNHDVYACLLVRSSVALLHPCSANTTCVVERQLAVSTFSDGPAKNAAIEDG